jgi:Peptidase M30
MKHLSTKFLTVPLVCLALVSCGGGGGPAPESAITTPITTGSTAASTTPSLQHPVLAGALEPGCNGANCAAVNANTYSGSGIGIWRFDNTSDADVSVNVDIAGVTAGKNAMLVFSNGSQASASVPLSGVLASPVTSDVMPPTLSSDAGNGKAAESAGHDDAHMQILEKNRAVANGLMRSRSSAPVTSDLASSLPGVARLSFSTTVVNDTKTWIDNFPATPVSYATTAQFICTSVAGRKVVWWVDPNLVVTGKFTKDDLNAALKTMQDSYCGALGGDGGLSKLSALLGDVWGSGATKFSKQLIQDAPGTFLDVNVVLLDVPLNIGWAGYFSACNNLVKASCAGSNEALAFFINAAQLKSDVNFLTSTLLHESTHMVNFYQRAVLQNTSHDTWLEETSAMMTEDIVTPSVLGGYNKIINVRLPDYLKAGGDVSYLNWPRLLDASSHYAIGSGFGAFLNRRYGLAIYKGLSLTCSDGPATSTTPARTSYDCLDGLIKANGGAGFSDEFSRFGTTVFGQLPAVGAPAGYGYPSVQAGAYTLQAKDLSSTLLAVHAPLASGFAATSQTYQRDTIAFGKTSYVRNNVVVPAHTTLTLTIK